MSPARDPSLPDFTDPVAEPFPAPARPAADEARRLRAETLAARHDARAAAAARVRAQGGDPDGVEVIAESPAYGAAAPRVTVCIPLFEQGAEVADALASVAVQDLDDIEVLIHDDASTDDSADVARRLVQQRPWLAARVLRRTVNAGLPTARNTLLAEARAPYALMLDADNALYPRAASRLAAALDADPTAAFAYGTLAVHRDGRPDGLLSDSPWDPLLLRADNPIDALALVRVETIAGLGGYTTDDALHGWEDYELWVHIAAQGGHGVHAGGFVGRYRRAAGSMLALTDLDQDGMRALLQERYPAVMGPVAGLP